MQKPFSNNQSEDAQQSAASPTELLYALERAVENAEYHLMMAELQLQEAARMHTAATAAKAVEHNPELYKRIKSRLEKTIACSTYGVKSA